MAAHRYWRINCTATENGTSDVRIAEIEFRASLGGADATGSGSAIQSSGNGALAFDDNAGTEWQTSLDLFPVDVGYDFVSPIEIAEVVITGSSNGPSSPLDCTVDSSDDKSVWTTELTINDGNWSVSEVRTYQLPWAALDGSDSEMLPLSGSGTGLTGGNSSPFDVQAMLPLEGIGLTYGGSITAMLPLGGSGSVIPLITISANLALPSFPIDSVVSVFNLNEGVLTGFNTGIAAYSGGIVSNANAALSVSAAGTVDNIARANLRSPLFSVDSAGNTGVIGGANLNQKLTAVITAYSGAQVTSLDGFNTEIISNSLLGSVGLVDIDAPRITVTGSATIEGFDSVQIRPPFMRSIYGICNLNGFNTKITGKSGFDCEVL